MKRILWKLVAFTIILLTACSKDDVMDQNLNAPTNEPQQTEETVSGEENPPDDESEENEGNTDTDNNSTDNDSSDNNNSDSNNSDNSDADSNSSDGNNSNNSDSDSNDSDSNDSDNNSADGNDSDDNSSDNSNSDSNSSDSNSSDEDSSGSSNDDSNSNDGSTDNNSSGNEGGGNTGESDSNDSDDDDDDEYEDDDDDDEYYGDERTYVPDDGFEQTLIDLGYDDKMDDYVYTGRIEKVEELVLIGNYGQGYGQENYMPIYDLTGMEDFKYLKKLQLIGLELEKKPELHKNEYMEELWLAYLKVYEEYHISNFKRLKILTLEETLPKDITNNPELREIYVQAFDVYGEHLNIANNKVLKKIDMTPARAYKISITNNDYLEGIRFIDSEAREFELANCERLRILRTENSKIPLEYVKFEEFPYLEELVLRGNDLMYLDVSYNYQLKWLKLFNHQLRCVKVNQEQYRDIPDGWVADPEVHYSMECEGS